MSSITIRLFNNEYVISIYVFVRKRKAKRVVLFDENGKEINDMDVTIDAGKKRTVTAAPDPPGTAFQTGDVLVWTVSPEGGVALFPSSDGLSCDWAWRAAGTQVVTVTGHDVNGKVITGSANVITNAKPVQVATGIALTVGDQVDDV
jgi:hypothetical protein